MRSYNHFQINIKISSYYIAMNNTLHLPVRTHTYWMTVKEYNKWSKSRPVEIKMNNCNNMTRTHVRFV